ncbi:hypothetical protein HanXRQr2_Chr07g0314131 [Helianthus annuus]|uniref:Uncharacterized protein n=1 Tax=Helianthus annuus TaxID=4232 RepID=A0A251UEG4_HELAN|nr:uncharacterized protein LOC110869128 isoform X4 [Helianthus annuus]KAF5800268.1 hypothetical protein HanXRQr2_Chr07g0314131 [Helianthus annuus]KAJ0551610.1 hypothetical protein HanHA300_Chr07g0259061 [Helianthus annuus]KAJ0564590.1 hypothetical protein HanHA89_Chr07g0276021 [Helianthus annuus]KAJ0732632.1 hypothetical protein HanOQP8_Chr07g0265381 [Helianthus annuus]KAJ0906279.1 hypothetical protein HanPSC8_Chr07g0303721 [Helianthus annuus]
MMTKEMVYAAAASSSLANAQDEYNELRFEFGIELDDVLLWVQTRLPLNGTSLNTRKLDEETENLSYETRPKSYFVWNDPCTINVPLVFVCKY